MNKLYEFIVSKYDLSLLKKIYGISLRNVLNYGIDAHYIDNINVLKLFNDIYLDVKDKFDETYLQDIKLVSDKYLFLIGRIKEYEELEKYNRNNYSISYEPFIDNECIDYVRQNFSVFSLNEFFNSNHFDDNFGGVCLISKSQTVCMYNDDSLGYIGSGYHNDSFHKIIKAIYNQKFVDSSGLKFNDTGQDIKVSFSNGFSGIIRIFVDVPVPINSSQLKSLEILNDEIKKLKEDNGSLLEISASIVNFNDDDFFLEFDGSSNLDDVIKWALISDSYKPFYEDKNMVGFINGENHFNDGNIKYGKQK